MNKLFSYNTAERETTYAACIRLLALLMINATVE